MANYHSSGRKRSWCVSTRQATAADAEHTIAARAAGEQAVREREAKFPTLTAENAGEAMAWQEARLRELMAPIDARWRSAQGRR